VKGVRISAPLPGPQASLHQLVQAVELTELRELLDWSVQATLNQKAPTDRAARPPDCREPSNPRVHLAVAKLAQAAEADCSESDRHQ